MPRLAVCCCRVLATRLRIPLSHNIQSRNFCNARPGGWCRVCFHPSVAISVFRKRSFLVRNAVELHVVRLPGESCNKPSYRLGYWSLRVSPFSHDRSAIALTGRVFGHPEFANGTEIVTSPLWLIIRTETADLAYTNTAVYELCAAHPDLIAAFLEPD